MLFRLPEAASVIENPSRDEVKELAAKMPNAKPTACSHWESGRAALAVEDGAWIDAVVPRTEVAESHLRSDAL